MDNTKYYNRDFKAALASVELKTGTSKEGNPYTYLNLVFINGYSKRLFLNDEALFALRNAIDTLASSQAPQSTPDNKKVDSSDFWAN